MTWWLHKQPPVCHAEYFSVDSHLLLSNEYSARKRKYIGRSLGYRYLEPIELKRSALEFKDSEKVRADNNIFFILTIQSPAFHFSPLHMLHSLAVKNIDYYLIHQRITILKFLLTALTQVEKHSNITSCVSQPPIFCCNGTSHIWKAKLPCGGSSETISQIEKLQAAFFSFKIPLGAFSSCILILYNILLLRIRKLVFW